MKKLLSAVLALSMILTLTACGNTAVTEPEPDPDPEPSSDAVETAPATVEGIVKEVSSDKIIITLADGTALALTTSGIADLDVQVGDTVKAEYTGAVGAMTASKVEVTAKAEKEVTTVSGVVTKVDDEYVFLTLEDGTEAALRTVSMEEGEVEEGDTLTIHYTDGGGTILSVDVTKAEKEPETPAPDTAASTTTSSTTQKTPAQASQAISTHSAVIVTLASVITIRLDDGKTTTITWHQLDTLDGAYLPLAGDQITVGLNQQGEIVSLTPPEGGRAGSYAERIGNTSGNDNWDDGDDDEDYTPSNKGNGSNASSATGDVYEAIRLINAERAKNGLAALEVNSDLMEMAAIRADEISELYDLNHFRPDGRSFETVLTDFGWELRKYSENIDASSATAAGTVERWMNSSGHKAHILRDNVTQIGVGYCYDSNSKWKHYWVMLVTN